MKGYVVAMGVTALLAGMAPAAQAVAARPGASPSGAAPGGHHIRAEHQRNHLSRYQDPPTALTLAA